MTRAPPSSFSSCGSHTLSLVGLAAVLFCCSSPPLVAAWTTNQRQHNALVDGLVPRQLFRRTLLQSSTSSSSDVVPADERYFSHMEVPLPTSSATKNKNRRITLTRYLDQAVQTNPELQEVTSLLLAVQMACKTISNLVNRAGLAAEERQDSNSTPQDGRYYSMQRLDQLCTAVLRNALKFTGRVQVQSPPVRTAEDVADHQPGVLLAKTLDSQLLACFDPLDGSGNADASICTGTVFGVFNSDSSGSDDNNDDWEAQVLQPAAAMKAAGYCLYSSATVLVFTLDDETVQGFTLDPQTHEFVLTHRNLTVPNRGSVYSCNQANAPGWDPRVRQYFEKIQTGEGQSGQRYALRYVGSLVGDIHRTLTYGGLFAYPSDSHAHPDGNLQLLYKTAPLAKIVAVAGGLGLDQTGTDLLQVTPDRIHAKRPCFLGSREDIQELKEYLI